MAIYVLYYVLTASAKVYKLKGGQELMITTKLTLKLNSHLYVLHVVVHEMTTCSYKNDTYYNTYVMYIH